MKQKIINVDPELMGGTPVFMGSRVPIQSLFDHLAHNYSIEAYLDQFPTVRRELVVELLETLGQMFDEKLIADENLIGREYSIEVPA